jgi:septum formation protein
VLTIRELTTWNATRKALKAAHQRRDAVVLGADTLVALDDKIIGKPADLSQAAAIIRQLSGRVHEVCTAVFICRAGGKKATSFHVFSRVKFRDLSEREIASYLAKINPLDKAGAYGAQGHGAQIIHDIRGSYTNVVGLPMKETVHALSAFGIEPAAT